MRARRLACSRVWMASKWRSRASRARKRRPQTRQRCVVAAAADAAGAGRRWEGWRKAAERRRRPKEVAVRWRRTAAS
uniref:Uncharacterized protein n=1 Tax=Arundo donax TaxID=35708 RepID=A0A0A9FFZ2_ARUDO